ncbi:hypothetical protein [Bacteroides uniformis]|uniref:hypothetical protein n=1 Tax=Bacteroides uniformis TaxID=820 RepID=UPI001105A795|nr:hypothetical protein [Bacteroides uniformis]MDC1864210.1 hypothetical protein [Bacteroides uniformis]MDC1867252.1 hypothetical protein [Bacteroides uniformis]
MTEELVTLETAKLLKEKGFKEDVFTFYEAECVEGDLELFEGYEAENFNVRTDCFSAPSQSIAQKWLRETKNLHIEISYMYENYWIYDILTIPNHDLVGLSDRPLEHYKSYEEALEAGILEALKLI